MKENAVQYKRLESILIAAIKTTLDTRDQILPLFDRLRLACGEAVCGDPIAIFHNGAVKDGFVVEAAFPVSRPVETDEVHTRTLEAAPALAIVHNGPHATIRESGRKVIEHLQTHAWTGSSIRREVYRVLDGAGPEQNVTEVQFILHEWDRLLAEGAEKVLGKPACQALMQGIQAITPDSSLEEYTSWIQGAMARLDALTESSEQKYQVVSRCAHVFPQERIDLLRSIYEQGDFDAILREMYLDDFWYEKPVRRGNVITMRKNPYDEDGYAKATTPSERRKAYCHCIFVRPYLDDDNLKAPALSSTFCYCGAGWYRQLWEGILGQPVKIAHVETLLRGNDQCTLTITLPLELTGECAPME